MMIIYTYICTPFCIRSVIKNAVRTSKLARGCLDNILVSGNGFEEVHIRIAFHPPILMPHWSDQLLSPVRTIDYLLRFFKLIYSG